MYYVVFKSSITKTNQALKALPPNTYKVDLGTILTHALVIFGDSVLLWFSIASINEKSKVDKEQANENKTEVSVISRV